MSEIIFKTEDSMWQMMAAGKKTWDARQYEIGDDRIYRLSWSSWEEDPAPGRQPAWTPDEDFVSFLNKKTGELLTFRFGGLEFAVWSPGWVFIILRGLVQRRFADGTVVKLEGVCRVCGCTDQEACLTPEGPCHWVEEDLCSRCSDA